MLGFGEICMQLTLSVLSLPMPEQNAVKEKIRCWPVRWKTWDKNECLSAKPNSLHSSLFHFQGTRVLEKCHWLTSTWRKFSRKLRLWEFLWLKDTLYGTRGKKGEELGAWKWPNAQWLCSPSLTKQSPKFKYPETPLGSQTLLLVDSQDLPDLS